MVSAPLEGFLSLWNQAHATYGTGTPSDGSQFDQSSRLLDLQESVTSAAPNSRWTGAAADSYSEANSAHARTLGNLADLDKRLGAEVGRSAAVVAAGRRDLEAVRTWVVDAAAAVPNTAAAQRMLWPVISRGSKELQDIVNRSTADLSAIAQRVRGLGSEYEELGKPKEGIGAEPMGIMGEGDDGKGGTYVPKDTMPRTTLDLDDIERRPPFVPGDPSTYGPPGGIEIGPGTWLRRNDFPGVEPTPPKAPLDYRDIDYRGPKSLAPAPWMMELVPDSGAWVPNPNYPGFIQHPPEVPVDMATATILEPGQLVPSGMIELYPGASIAIPDPTANAPR